MLSVNILKSQALQNESTRNKSTLAGRDLSPSNLKLVSKCMCVRVTVSVCACECVCLCVRGKRTTHKRKTLDHQEQAEDQPHTSEPPNVPQPLVGISWVQILGPNHILEQILLKLSRDVIVQDLPAARECVVASRQLLD